MMRQPLAVALLLAAACAPARAPIVHYTPPVVRAGQAPAPYSRAVRVGDILFVSGALGSDSTGRVVPGGIEAETRQALENIRASLHAAGSSMDRVAKCTVMLVDMTEWDRMNVVYRTFFPPDRLPARTALGVSALVRGARVEIECLAAAGATK